MFRRAIAAALVAAVALTAIIVASPASATNQSSHGGHHFRFGSVPVSVIWRNQIGPGIETQYIHNGLARWGSQNASAYYPAGPARTDYSFAYAYGGLPSCDQTGPSNDITICVVANGWVSQGGWHNHYNNKSIFHTALDATDHFVYAYIHINVNHRYDEGVYCHEMGHALGVAHLNSGTTCMRPENNLLLGTAPGQHNLDTSVAVNAHGHN